MVAVTYGLVVRIPAFHVGGPGSIPGVGTSVELRRLDVIVELGASSVEYRGLTPAAIGLGIGVKRGNGGSDNGVESCEIIVGMFMSGLS